MTTNPLLQYIWPFTLGILIINIAFGHVKARALVSSGRVTAEERLAFTRSAVLFSVTYCSVQWAIQIASRSRDPLCLVVFPPRGAYGMASWLIAIGGVLFLLRRLWEGGAELFARLAPAFLRGSIDRQFTPYQVRFVVTAILVLAIVGNVVMQLLNGHEALACLADRGDGTP
jgi:hypothetical protein